MLINEALLIAVLALTTYAVLTVDQSAWRGWYFSEILYRIPLDNWNAYESAIGHFAPPLEVAAPKDRKQSPARCAPAGTRLFKLILGYR